VLNYIPGGMILTMVAGKSEVNISAIHLI